MPRMQHTALVFAAIYVGLNVLLTIIYKLEGMTVFDALCHAFGTMATGGFSTYNASLGHFDSSLIEYTTIVFMILAGTNFTLLYLTLIGGPLRLFQDVEFRTVVGIIYLTLVGGPKRLFQDVEFRTFIGIIVIVTVGVVFFGIRNDDVGFSTIPGSIRAGLFTVVSILTTTGYGTANFDEWNAFGRGILLLLMFIGGCAGSTGGGIKVIRHILFYKILRLEIEKSHRPRVVRLIRIGGSTVDEPNLPHSIVVYFSMILALFVFGWLLLITFEPNTMWEKATISSEAAEMGPVYVEATVINNLEEKLLDSASAIAATLNNIGPGLGVVGAERNYAGFSQGAKLLFVWLMMLGRVEVFSVLVLFFPSFWRRA